MKWEVKEYTEGEPGRERKGYLIREGQFIIAEFHYEPAAILACVAVNSDQAKTEALEAVKEWLEIHHLENIWVDLYEQVCEALKQSGL